MKSDLVRGTYTVALPEGPTTVAVFSRETALALHDLGDANPARIHLTVPRASASRCRLRLSGIARCCSRAIGRSVRATA